MFVLAIAGGSACGKSTLAGQLAERFEGRVAVLHHDDYYVHRPELTLAERTRVDYERLEAIESTLLVKHLQALHAGESVESPLYDFALHLRCDTGRLVEPRPVVIVDGLMVLAEPLLQPLLDLRLFVELDDDTRFIRRLQRDVRDRGRSVESVIEQYTSQVKPFHETVVRESRSRADLVVVNQDFERVTTALVRLVDALR